MLQRKTAMVAAYAQYDHLGAGHESEPSAAPRLRCLVRRLVRLLQGHRQAQGGRMREVDKHCFWREWSMCAYLCICFSLPPRFAFIPSSFHSLLRVPPPHSAIACELRMPLLVAEQAEALSICDTTEGKPPTL